MVQLVKDAPTAKAVLYLGPHTRPREAKILCRHRRHFSLFRRAARLASEVLANSPAPGTPQQLLVLGLFSRLHEAAQAGARLAQAGLERDVAVSIRTAFELFVKLKAAASVPDFVTRYDFDTLVQQRKLANANVQNPDLDRAAKTRLQRRVEELDIALVGLQTDALSIEQLATKVGLQWEYGTVYRMTSPYVHGAGRAVAEYAYYKQDGSFGGFEFGATDSNTELYVDTLTEYLLRAIREVAAVFRVDVRSRLAALRDRLASVSDEASEGGGSAPGKLSHDS